MAENRAQAADQNCNRTGAFREAVCVNASRIYDSCGEKHYARYMSLLCYGFSMLVVRFSIQALQLVGTANKIILHSIKTM